MLKRFALSALAAGLATPALAQPAFTLKPRVIFQVDTARYDNDRGLDDGTSVRRARLGAAGKAFGGIDYDVTLDFAGVGRTDGLKVISAWAQRRFEGPANLRLRAGAFSAPTGLEDASPNTGSLFAERAAPAEMVRSIASGDGRKAVALYANSERWTASAAFTGNVLDAGLDGEQHGIVARAAWLPVRTENGLVHLGLNLTEVLEAAASGPGAPLRLGERPENRVDPTRLVDTGRIDAHGLSSRGVELGAQHGRFHAQAEHYAIRLDRKGPLPDPDFTGWYVQAGWSLTGEPRRYAIASGGFDAPKPGRPFDPASGGWGAWEVGLRYSHLDLDDAGVRGGVQDAWTLGLGWRPTERVRLIASLHDVAVARRSAAGAALDQDFRIYSLRTQYAF